MKMCRDLKFEETPPYAKMRRLFKDLYNKCFFDHEYIYDWTIQRYRLDLPSYTPVEQVQQLGEKTSTLPDSLKVQEGIS